MDFLEKEEEYRKERRTVISSDVSHELRELFTRVQQDLSMLSTGKLRTTLEDTYLSFVNEPQTPYLAWAYRESNLIEWNVHQSIAGTPVYALIHEFAHIIVRIVLAEAGHTLEFAIITYCLQLRLLNSKDHFFRSYDISEDKAYRVLSINPYQFDSFIMSIQWNDIDELCKKARFLADKIRSKNAFFDFDKLGRDYVNEVN